MTITTKFKSFFLDRAHIIKKVGEAKVKVLMRSGGRIRTIATRSMDYKTLRKNLKRKSKRTSDASPPGHPPYAHKEFGALLRKLLFFIYDERSDSVVIGPVAARKAEAPRLNEFGGMVKRRRRGGVAVARYPARPFMLPALSKEEPRLPKEWTGSVVGP